MLNRALLADMIGDAYRIIEAEDGKQAVAALQKEGAGISLVLLDYVMPQMNGFDVLEVMNKNGWIKDIPVIMVSAESDAAYIERAYELGVTDFINRPYDVNIVRRRVMNTLMLYQKQRTLMGMVADQVYEREKSNNLMVYILSHIVVPRWPCGRRHSHIGPGSCPGRCVRRPYEPPRLQAAVQPRRGPAHDSRRGMRRVQPAYSGMPDGSGGRFGEAPEPRHHGPRDFD